jgi:glutathione peroxidase-family protein
MAIINIKRLLYLIILLFFFELAPCQSIYTLPSKDIAGSSFHMDTYKNKKLLIVILSPATTDSLMDEITRFREKYGDKVEVIGLMVQDDGLGGDNPTDKDLAEKMKSKNLVLLGGGTVRNGNTQNASRLLQWLTDQNNAHAFTKGVTLAGCKYFIGEQGKILNVIPPETPLDAPIIPFIVNAKPQTEN